MACKNATNRISQSRLSRPQVSGHADEVITSGRKDSPSFWLEVGIRLWKEAGGEKGREKELYAKASQERKDYGMHVIW